MLTSMTGRERIMAALQKKAVDRIPWTPLINPYSIAGFPETVPHYVPDITEQLGCDVFARFGKVVKAVPRPKLGAWLLPIYKFDENGDMVIGFKTPAGTITRIYSSKGNGSLPGPKKFLLETEKDLKVYSYILEKFNSVYKPDYELFNYENKIIGDRGILSVSLELSPFESFIEDIAGIENTYNLITDAPELFDNVMHMLHEKEKKRLKAMAESPAEVFIHYENTSSTVLSPSIYKKYCVPFYEEYADIFHDHGKIYLIHACGKLKAFKDIIRNEKFDGITDITPGPVGDTELWEACEDFGGKVVMGGIDCLTFTQCSPEECYEKAAHIIRNIKQYNGVLLGSGDSVPCGTSMECLEAVSRAVRDLGTY